MKRLLSCLALVCVAAFVAADDKAWTKFDSKEGKCQIEFPGKPNEQINAKEKSGQIVLSALGDRAAFMLQFNDMLSKTPLDQAETVKKIFDGGQEGLTKTLKGKIAKSEDGKFGKYPARDILMEDVPQLGSYRVKFVLTGEKFYQITAAGPADFVKGDDVKKFMGSFKLND